MLNIFLKTRVRIPPRPPIFSDSLVTHINSYYIERLYIKMVTISKSEAEKKVYELTEKLIFTKKDFKDIAAGYKEKIRDLENEIKAVVEEAEAISPTVKNPVEDEI